MRAWTHTHTQTHTHVCIHAYAHACIHAHAYTRKHLYIYIPIWKSLKKQAISMKNQQQIYTCNFTSSELSVLEKFLVII